MNRQAQAVLLSLLGGAVLYAGSTDLYLRYVKAGLRPLMLGTGIVLIVAAIATIWYERRRRPTTQDSHTHREPRISWLLVLPLFALILIKPPALDSYSGMRTGTALPVPFGFPALPAGSPLPLSVLDYAGRAVYDHGRSLHDRQIQLTGFVAIDKDGTVYLIRMILNCCAADAQPVKIGLTGQVPPVLQPDTWLEITGTYTSKQTTDPLNNGAIPFIDVQQAKPVQAPSDPYEGLG
ncbi:putative repeat protein (TIGR03943 family) [Kibdelosporangium banguiense]|uniref:Repeat protein (TIGR03943 family) n=1 Tax=Kibdelosporangium banguiense TaxID=1365924 RepID=A0ABS4TVQ5_9PSEU|nr:TIGR03943 family protein [Kibdelosporangium banguiense]MBP2328043.1 putative repeat protein (TIGR03943 family) [Kibdelosporangium banguiense]